ncbi:MAG TPA: shikimate dehydrogenase [Pyrinomonadaceae bacterium]|nr:shikimate dehydrogenase [Pyrinomonadaceae bacterium]
MPNNGKICVSVTAQSASEMLEKIRSVAASADVVEIRFDSLEEAEIKPLVDQLPSIAIPILITFRPREQGGYRDLTFADRVKFWESVVGEKLGPGVMVDHEIDIDFALQLDPESVILSMHDFNSSGESMSADAFMELNAATIKIAVAVDDVTDAIHVWNMLRGSNKAAIPIAMGEAGKWTRILGLAHGAPLTYAAPDEGQGTAPGQISAGDLCDVFRVKELDRDTRIFGVVAGDTTYSLSPFMHNAAFKEARLNSVFVPLQVADLDPFIRRMVRPDTCEVELTFGGLSVTNPHKQAMIAYLDEIDPTASAIGAVNTVKVDGNKLIGYNTDAGGFLEPLQRELGDVTGANAVVVGAGGAARACVYALQQAGTNVTLLARDPAKASTFKDEFGISVLGLETENWKLETGRKPDILVNATPTGTRGPNQDESIATADELRNVKLVYDLVYNPLETRLLQEAKRAGAKTLGGLDMLIAQGVKQFEIWTGREAPVNEMRSAIEKRLQ